MPQIDITADGYSVPLDIPDYSVYKLELDATTLDPDFLAILQIASTGLTNWRDTYVGGSAREFNSQVLELVAVGNQRYRLNVSGFGDTVGAILKATELTFKPSPAGVEEIATSIQQKLLTHPVSVTSFDMQPLNIEITSMRPIVFSWPNTGVTIISEIKQADGSYVATEAVVEQISSTSGDYEYRLPYEADDRLTDPGSQRLRFRDGTYTAHLTLNYGRPLTTLTTGVAEDAF